MHLKKLLSLHTHNSTGINTEVVKTWDFPPNLECPPPQPIDTIPIENIKYSSCVYIFYILLKFTSKSSGPSMLQEWQAQNYSIDNKLLTQI